MIESPRGLVVDETLRDRAYQHLHVRVDVLVAAQRIRMVVAHRGTNLVREIIKKIPFLDRLEGAVLSPEESYFNSS